LQLSLVRCLSRVGSQPDAILGGTKRDNCNPPESEVELQTLYQALPIVMGDFAINTIVLTDSNDGTVTTAAFTPTTVTLTDSGGMEDYKWLIDNEYPMLILEGTGAVNDVLPYTRIVLIDGTFIALVGEATDINDGKVDINEFPVSGTFEAIAMLTSN